MSIQLSDQLKNENSEYRMLVKIQRNHQLTDTLLVEMFNGTATLQKSSTVSHETKNATTI